MRRYAALLTAVAVTVMAACSRYEPFVLPPPPTTQTPVSTEPPVDFSKMGLPAAAGRTTTTIPIGPGPSSLKGTVIGPGGAVPGATVQLVRLVGSGAGVLNLTTQPDGTWEALNILGGRYRVRAWLAPGLAQPDPEIFFLSGAEPKVLNLKVQSFQGLAVGTAVAPSPPEVGVATSLVVAVTDRVVGDDGVVRATPVARVSVELQSAGGWRLDTTNPTTTDASGQARWTARCQRSGSQPLGVLVGGSQSFTLSVPDCEPPPPTTTSTTSRSTTSTTSRSTSTTA